MAKKLSDPNEHADHQRQLNGKPKLPRLMRNMRRSKTSTTLSTTATRSRSRCDCCASVPRESAIGCARSSSGCSSATKNTNASQAALVHEVAGKDGNLTVVGDDNQSIYAFQGAAIGNILAFEKEYGTGKGAKASALSSPRTTAARSQSLMPASRPIEKNPDRLAAQDGFDKRLRAVAEQSKAEPQLLKFPTVTDEAEAVVKKFAEHQAQGVPWKEMAVLVRRRDLGAHFFARLHGGGHPRPRQRLRPTLRPTGGKALRVNFLHNRRSARITAAQVPRC